MIDVSMRNIERTAATSSGMSHTGIRQAAEPFRHCETTTQRLRVGTAPG
jgi:hypothetical protein